MEKPLKKTRLPKTDSIKKLAEFWDSHDLTDFEEELEEVDEPVFVRRTAIKVPLEAHEAEAVQQMAQANHLRAAPSARSQPGNTGTKPRPD